MRTIATSGDVAVSEEEARVRELPPYVDIADIPAGWRLWGEVITILRRTEFEGSRPDPERPGRSRRVMIPEFSYTARAFVHDPADSASPLVAVEQRGWSRTQRDPRRWWIHSGPNHEMWIVPRPLRFDKTMSQVEAEQRRRRELARQPKVPPSEAQLDHLDAQNARRTRLDAEDADRGAVLDEIRESENGTIGKATAKRRVERARQHIEAARSPKEVAEGLRMHGLTQKVSDDVGDAEILAAAEQRCRRFVDLAVEALELEGRGGPSNLRYIKTSLIELTKRLGELQSVGTEPHAVGDAARQRWTDWVAVQEASPGGGVERPAPGRPAPSSRATAARGTGNRPMPG